MTALVIAEHDNAVLKGGTANAVTAAHEMAGEVHVLVAGLGAKTAAEAAPPFDEATGRGALAEGRTRPTAPNPIAATPRTPTRTFRRRRSGRIVRINA